MRYAQAKDLPAQEFKRLFGVQPRTFIKMVETMRHHRKLKKTSGSPFIEYRRPSSSCFAVLARIPHVLSYCSGLGRVRSNYLPGCSSGRNYSSPKKKPRGGQLSAADKRDNRELARVRVLGEHVNRHLKIFHILGERYRNRRRRFGLRCNLICALYNYELRVAQ